VCVFFFLYILLLIIIMDSGPNGHASCLQNYVTHNVSTENILTGMITYYIICGKDNIFYISLPLVFDSIFCFFCFVAPKKLVVGRELSGIQWG
jgi:hypothetical protein